MSAANTPASAATDKPAISVQQVSFSYDGPPALSEVDLDVAEREFLGIVGPNAGGKTTLLRLILGLLTPDRGRIQIFGRSVQRARREIGYVPQYPRFRRDFPITVEEVVLSGRLGTGSWLGRPSREDFAVAQQAMAETEVERYAKRLLSTLSGGQLQRVLVARALATQPRILILDEPTANIDMRVENDIFELLRQLNQRMTILVVSHDVAFISRYVVRVACLNRRLVTHHTHAIDGKVIAELYDESVHMVNHAH